jgi:hypothetical protein
MKLLIDEAASQLLTIKLSRRQSSHTPILAAIFTLLRRTAELTLSLTLFCAKVSQVLLPAAERCEAPAVPSSGRPGRYSHEVVLSSVLRDRCPPDTLVRRRPSALILLVAITESAHRTRADPAAGCRSQSGSDADQKQRTGARARQTVELSAKVRITLGT